ncbi:MAG TPA: YegS/Rv2252/BmrU family lipid kinase [Kofleriaceae bacterium]|nr:YegS/Rv2252/BmrU family lipid kinase [Kofleriaceae bacterium]
MRAALIYNPKAGGPSSPGRADLTALLESRCQLTVFETTRERDADACSRDALAGGAELVIAAGGDGTTSLVAGTLSGSSAALGVIPCGTANSVAEALGIPRGHQEAADLLFTAEPRQIDLARCGDAAMLQLCSVGFHADTIADASRELKNRWGVFAYVAKGLEHLFAMEPFDVELETEAHRIRCRATSVTVANLAPPRTVVAQGPAFIRPDDGLLDVTVVAASGLVEAVAAGLHLFRTATRGEPAHHDRIGYFACTRVRITTSEPRRVVCDGEALGETPVELEILPRALRLIAPPAAVDEEAAPAADLSRLPDVRIERA